MPKFVRAYNDIVLFATGMAQPKVTESDILAIWNRMNVKRRSVRAARAKFRVGQHVRISKEKMKFCKRLQTETPHGDISDC